MVTVCVIRNEFKQTIDADLSETSRLGGRCSGCRRGGKVGAGRAGGRPPTRRSSRTAPLRSPRPRWCTWQQYISKNDLHRSVYLQRCQRRRRYIHTLSRGGTGAGHGSLEGCPPPSQHGGCFPEQGSTGPRLDAFVPPFPMESLSRWTTICFILRDCDGDGYRCWARPVSRGGRRRSGKQVPIERQVALHQSGANPMDLWCLLSTNQVQVHRYCAFTTSTYASSYIFSILFFFMFLSFIILMFSSRDVFPRC